MSVWSKVKGELRRLYKDEGGFWEVAAPLIGGVMGALGGKDDAKIKKTSTMTPEQEALMKEFTSWLQPKVGVGATPYGGPTMTPGEMEGLGQVREFARGVSPEEAEARFRSDVLPAAQRMFQETTLPGVREAYGRSGFYGTPRAEAETGAHQRFGEWAQQGVGEAITRGRESGFQALPMLMQAEQVPYQREFEEFLRTQPEYAPYIDQILATLGIGTQAAYGVPSQPGIGQRALEGAVGGASLYKSLS